MRPALLPSFKRWTPWIFALALLLKAAVPLLATAAAHAQGRTLVEVCTVYGVATVAIDDTGAPAQADEHGSDHCVLSGLLLGAALDAREGAVARPAPAREAAPLRVERSPAPPDACADWVAQRKHGPPPTA